MSLVYPCWTVQQSPLIASDAISKLGSSLDAFIIGNEPDMYFPHKLRPNLKNYTERDYISEYRLVADSLITTSAGDIRSLKLLAGPSSCCTWDLATLMEKGFLSEFRQYLKYVTLQHYPQNNCFGKHKYEIPYYMRHANVVELGRWQQHGIEILRSDEANPRLAMSEFNSVSCGGIPGISDTFAVGALWTLDYALQMAAVGYTAAYLHTREAGISYNIIDAPGYQTGGASRSWVTLPPYYAVLAGAEIFPQGGGYITDIDLDESTTNPNSTVAGYAVYDAKNTTLTKIVLFNFADAGGGVTRFAIPVNSTTAGRVTVKFLTASSAKEKVNIAWGGQTFAGVSDGVIVEAKDQSWSTANQDIDCNNGCSVDIPGPGMAVVFLAGDSGRSAVRNWGGQLSFKTCLVSLISCAMGISLALGASWAL
ncbi:hypothetical protein HGRIS_007392 [Hohenbuehelia grisea]|uniref:Beta-glucuronidase C-terminal domain-containing protein n=1 Tax=Hohenbuehelia grisea TaxID=104357 RepID=A0ABR3J4N1_9AGAR